MPERPPPKSGYVRTRVLVLVKTYPHPSATHGELVCTAGITADGQWVRIYPVDFRYRNKEQQYGKYQWIDVDLRPRPRAKDGRPESHEPDLESLVLVGDPIPSTRNWKVRREILDTLPHRSLAELESAWEASRVSLGIVRPAEVFDLEIRPTTEKWKDAWESFYQQGNLFEEVKRLSKIPYTFHYIFRCADDPADKQRSAMNEDWELGIRFLRERIRLGDDRKAAEAVREIFFTKMCGPDKDLRFFVGTKHPYNTWLVLGTFYPTKEAPEEPTLFG